MRINTNIATLLILCYLGMFLLYCSHDNKAYEAAVPFDAYEIRYISKYRFIKCVEFKIRVPNLSKEILRYYDNTLQKKGWIPFIEEYYSEGHRTWLSFGSQSRLAAFWIDKQKTKRIALEIQQEPLDIMRSADTTPEQIVTYEERPYYELPYSPDFYLIKKEK